MQALGHEEYLRLRQGATVVEGDGFGDKVLLLPDGSYLKLFRRKRLITSAALKPYAQRFADNTAALARLGIPCPEVVALYRIASIGRDAVHYRPLAGATVRELVRSGLSSSEAKALRTRLLHFIGHLHALGIYFRSAHLGNIVLTPDDRLGLIDVADMKIGWFRLGPFRRRRNLRHVLRYQEDREWLQIDPAWKSLVR